MLLLPLLLPLLLLLLLLPVPPRRVRVTGSYLQGRAPESPQMC